ncbi:MAG: tRNA 2-thiouridine(34) synthase MnmA [Clostridiales bacterium]|nr:tRNA 2-thiouridine(34) synthase MnmA [Clostridiales bacterium]
MDKVIVAMSGGVDSSYAAWLLLQQGYAVEGVCLDLFPGSKAPADAAEAGDKLGVKVHVVQAHRLFHDKVVEAFCQAYCAGLTPNPCTMCNPDVKFMLLLQAADECGAQAIATGHYARTGYDPDTGLFSLLRGMDADKDQSYFLYRLGQGVLRRVLFPLGELTKEQVRRGAAAAGLPAAGKRDSQDICFIPDGEYQGFIRRYAGYYEYADDESESQFCETRLDNARMDGNGLAPGDFVDRSGKVIGRHEGVIHYTIGQHKGLGGAFGRAMYVLAIHAEENQVVLGPEEALYTHEVWTSENCFCSGSAPTEPICVEAKLRYSAIAMKARYYHLETGMGKLVFEEPVKAAAPGQSAVYYTGEQVFGGGTIANIML